VTEEPSSAPRREYWKIPASWAEKADEEREAWVRSFADAIKATGERRLASPGDT
jgi:hypothetical protein